MSNFAWQHNFTSDFSEPALYREWNYQEWYIKEAAVDQEIFIIQPKKLSRRYEIWRRCLPGTGDRYPTKNYKYITHFRSLKAAKLAYIMLWKSYSS